MVAVPRVDQGPLLSTEEVLKAMHLYSYLCLIFNVTILVFPIPVDTEK